MVQLIKIKYFNVKAATSTNAITTNATRPSTSSNSITTTFTVTTIIVMPKGMKVRLKKILKGEDELNIITPTICRLSKGHISNTLRAV